MVRDVRLFLRELRRLVLLWDEMWVAILQQIHPQVEQLFQKLQVQIQKLQKKGNLTEDSKKQLLHDNYQVLFKPVPDCFLSSLIMNEFTFFLIGFNYRSS